MTGYECQDCHYTTPGLENAMEHSENVGHTLIRETMDGNIITVSLEDW